ncbi:MAG: Replication factor A [Candidatus Heimdallarchaeota archaeon AB_125]|nr:MAG: Replication factor A [Candidatus Heimdallarchaeota archaeon AB_125]
MSSQRSLKEIVDVISTETGMGKEEIHQLINDKMEELGEFVTQLGAVHIVAREMGVDLSSEPPIQVQSTLSVNELVPELANVNLIGRIFRIYNLHNFKKKDGSDGVLQSVLVEDKTGRTRVVFWDQKVVELQENNCKVGDPIRILNGYTRVGRDESVEVHLGIRSQVQIRPSGIDDSVLPVFDSTSSKIKDIKGNEIDLSLNGKVTQKDDLLEFERSDGSKGVKQGLVLGDETGEIYVNFWNEKAHDVKDIGLGDIIEVVGLAAKVGLKGHLEMHSSKYTNVVKKEDSEDIIVKKGFVGSGTDIGAQLLPIAQITELSSLISTKGLIININPMHEFSRENESKGKVRDITISDNTGIIRVVLWDDKTQLINEDDVNKVISILNGFTRKGRYTDIEIHCGNQTRMAVESIDSNSENQYQFDFSNIKDITDDMNEAHIQGIVSDLSPIQDIKTKEDEIIQLRNLRVEDQSGTIRITCWRENIAKISDVSVGEGIEIYNASVKEDAGYGTELLINKNTIVKKSLNNSSNPQGFVSSLEVSPLKIDLEKITDIEDIKEGDEVSIQATVVKLIEKQFVYPLCPECKKKMKKENDSYSCANHGEKEKPLNRILFTFVANDGTGNINVLCAGKLAEIVLEMSADAAARMVEENESENAPYSYLKAKNFVNSELIISGKVNQNPYLKSLEIIANSIEKVRYAETTKNMVKQIHTE